MDEAVDAEGVVVVTTTTGSLGDARAIADALVSQRLAACVQIAAVESIYRWDGALRRDAEHLLQIKTVLARVLQVEACIKAHHGYDLPEVLATPALGGSDAYLDWVRASVAET